MSLEIILRQLSSRLPARILILSPFSRTHRRNAPRLVIRSGPRHAGLIRVKPPVRQVIGDDSHTLHDVCPPCHHRQISLSLKIFNTLLVNSLFSFLRFRQGSGPICSHLRNTLVCHGLDECLECRCKSISILSCVCVLCSCLGLHLYSLLFIDFGFDVLA